MDIVCRYKRCILIASILILVLGLPCACWIYLRFQERCSGWYSNDWEYRKEITIEDPVTARTDEDVLVEADTASLISGGKLQSDCDDLRFVDSDDSTLLNFWVEGGCNTNATQVWVRVPSIPIGGKSIYVYYDNDTATNSEQSWSGKFYVMKDSACDTGWTTESNSGGDFYERFPYPASSFGTTGGSSSHDHGSYNITSGDTGSQSSVGRNSGVTISNSDHTHTATLTTNSTTILPPYLDMIFCSNSDLMFKNDMVGIYTSATLPTNVTRYSSLDSKFPRGNSTAGGSGGSSTHSHPIQDTTTSNNSNDLATCPSGTIDRAANPHNHTLTNKTTGSDSNLPVYTTVVYGQADADISVSESAIVMSNSTPPYGWTRYSSLDNNFPYGGATYGTTGGASTHTHVETITTDYEISANIGCEDTTPKATRPYALHTHSFYLTTTSVSNNPPYIETIFLQKNTSLDTTLGSEQNSSGGTAPIFTNFSNNGGVNPGSSITFTATASDGDSENVFLVVCKTAGISGTACDGGSSDTYCTSSSVLSNPSCSYTEESVKPDGSYSVYPYVFDINNTPSSSSLQGAEDNYTVNNVSPVVSGVALNSGSSITLTESSNTSVSLTATVSDNNSCDGTEISSVLGYLYRSGVSYSGCDTSAEADNNDCYPEINCSMDGGSCIGSSDASATFTCTASVAYYADPTDSNTVYDTENWLDTIKAVDDDSATDSLEVSTGVEMNSLIAFNISTSVNYGPLDVGQGNDPLDKTTVITPTGNVGLDHECSAPNDMCTDYPTCSGSKINVGYQKYALASSTSYSSAIALSLTDTEVETNVFKPTSTSPSTKSLWGGLLVPSGTNPGVYSGAISITGIKGETGGWYGGILTPTDLEVSKTDYYYTSGSTCNVSTTGSAIFRHNDPNRVGTDYQLSFDNGTGGGTKESFSSTVDVDDRSESFSVVVTGIPYGNSYVYVKMWDDLDNESSYSVGSYLRCCAEADYNTQTGLCVFPW